MTLNLNEVIKFIDIMNTTGVFPEQISKNEASFHNPSTLNEFNKVRLRQISNEISSNKDLVSKLIGKNTHHGESGTYNEKILMKTLQGELEGIADVYTGFIVAINTDIFQHNLYSPLSKRQGMNNQQEKTLLELMKQMGVGLKDIPLYVSTQQDIIIVKKNSNHHFKQSDFVITNIENVLGVIEVKTSARNSEIDLSKARANSNNLPDILLKQKQSLTANYNRAHFDETNHLSNAPIFHGVFIMNFKSLISFKKNGEYTKDTETRFKKLSRTLGMVGMPNQYICLGDNHLITTEYSQHNHYYSHLLNTYFKNENEQNRTEIAKYFSEHYLDDGMLNYLEENSCTSQTLDNLSIGYFVSELKNHCLSINESYKLNGMETTILKKNYLDLFLEELEVRTLNTKQVKLDDKEAYLEIKIGVEDENYCLPYNGTYLL